MRKKVQERLLEDGFQKGTSLLVKISLLYLLLTVVNLIGFWIFTGSNQMRLISENAKLSTRSTAYELLRRLKTTTEKKDVLLGLISDRDNARKKFRDGLKVSAESAQLIVPHFEIADDEGTILFRHPEAQKSQLSVSTRQKIYKALQIREVQNQPYYGSPDLSEYNIEIIIPLGQNDGKNWVFYTSIPMENIRAELRSLFTLAIVMVCFMLVIQSFLGWSIYKMMILPIRKLASGAEAVGQGNLTVEIDKGRKKDELGFLMHLFNRMVASLRDKTSKLELTIEELERRNEIMQNELKMAQSIQQGIMPKDSLSDRIRIGVYYGPLAEVSGDYYDIFPLPDGSVGLLITDASGHGVPAALVTIMAKVHFTNYAEKFSKPGELFSRVNTELSRSITTSDYLTAFYLVIHPDYSVDYCNASHQKAILLRQDGAFDELDTGGFFLGAIAEEPFPYETHTLNIRPGDRIILYTDGIIEGTNSEGKEYGNERFREKILLNSEQPVDIFVKNIMEDVDSFAGKTPRKDDYTLFVIEVVPKDASGEELFQRAEKFYYDKNFSRAKEEFRGILHREPGNVNAQLYLAHCLFFLREYEEAIPHFESYNKLHKSNAYAHLKLGVCYSKIGSEQKALENYQSALKINSDLAEAHGQMAISHLNTGDMEKAREQIEKAISLKPGDERLRTIQERILSGVAVR